MLLKEVHNPQRFGVPVFDGDSSINVEEKPAVPASKNAVIGIYKYAGNIVTKTGANKL